MNFSALFWRIRQINQYWKFDHSKGWSASELEHFKAARKYASHGNVVQPVKQHLDELIQKAPKSLLITDFGAVSGISPQEGSISGFQREVPLEKMISQTASSQKWGRLLLRFAQLKSGAINLELGTNLGVGLRYLVSGSFFQHRWISIEGDPSTASLAREAFSKDSQVEVLTGRFWDVLPNVLPENRDLGLVFIDGHHDGAATMEYADFISAKVNSQGWMIFDDIRWSPSMKNSWEQLKTRPWVDRWADFGKMGVLVVK